MTDTRRRLSITPATAISLAALFFALGGSALAVGEHVQQANQKRCTNGAVRGIAVVTGNPAVGIANTPDQFSGAANLFQRRFNCTGRTVQVRRTGIGVYEVRFVGNPAPTALVSGYGPYTTTVEPIGAGTFRVRVQDVGREDEADGAFIVAAI